MNIDKAVENYQCPEPSFCTVATTCYDFREREHICLKCWLSYCKNHNIVVDYMGE